MICFCYLSILDFGRVVDLLVGWGVVGWIGGGDLLKRLLVGMCSCIGRR